MTFELAITIKTFELVTAQHNKIIIPRIAIFDTYIRSVLESSLFFFSYLSDTKTSLRFYFFTSFLFCICFLAVEEIKHPTYHFYLKVETMSFKVN